MRGNTRTARASSCATCPSTRATSSTSTTRRSSSRATACSAPASSATCSSRCAKGSRRGLVVLVIDVRRAQHHRRQRRLDGALRDADAQRATGARSTAYAGLDVAETNLAAPGITLGGAVAVAAESARAARALPGSGLPGQRLDGQRHAALQRRARLLRQRRRARGTTRAARTPATAPPSSATSASAARSASGADLSVATQLWLQLPARTHRREATRCRPRTCAARTRAHRFRHRPRPQRALDAARQRCEHDTRDQPFLPTRGWLASLTAELGLLPAAPTTTTSSVELDASHWWQLPWHEHVLALGALRRRDRGQRAVLRAVLRRRPQRLFAATRARLNFDRRPAPNFLGTDIVEVRYGNYARQARRASTASRSIAGAAHLRHRLFGSVGRLRRWPATRDITDPPLGYSGLARIPVDFTVNARLPHGHAARRLRVRVLERARLRPGARQGARWWSVGAALEHREPSRADARLARLAWLLGLAARAVRCFVGRLGADAASGRRMTSSRAKRSFDWDADTRPLLPRSGFPRRARREHCRRKLSRGLPTTIVLTAAVYRAGSNRAPLDHGADLQGHLARVGRGLPASKSSARLDRRAGPPRSKACSGAARRCTVCSRATPPRSRRASPLRRAGKIQINPVSPEAAAEDPALGDAPEQHRHGRAGRRAIQHLHRPVPAAHRRRRARGQLRHAPATLPARISQSTGSQCP